MFLKYGIIHIMKKKDKDTKKDDMQMCKLCVAMATKQDLRDILQILSKNITKIFGVKGCTIRFFDKRRQTLEIIAAYGLSKEYLNKGPIDLKNHYIDREILKGRLKYTRDITKEKHVLYLEQAKKEGIKSVLSVPLFSENKPIGVIRIYTSEPRDFRKEEIEILKALSFIGGVLAERAKIWDEMKVLVEISQAISSTLSLNEVLNMIVKNATEILGMKASSLRLLDAEKRYLELKASYGLSEEYIQKGLIEVEKSPIDKECLMCKVVIIKNIKKDKRLQYRDDLLREGIVSLVSLPLMSKGSAIGVLRVYSSIYYDFTERDIDFLRSLSCQGAIAIENARLFEHIKNEYKELSQEVWKWYDWGEHFPRL